MTGYGTSGADYDFTAYNALGAVWNGSAFVTWADADFADYRVAATEVGTSGRYTATAPTDAVEYEMRERGTTLADSVVVWHDWVSTLADIAARTVYIAASRVNVRLPLMTDGELLQIVRGADGHQADGREIPFSVADSVSAAGGSIALELYDAAGTLMATWAGTVTSAHVWYVAFTAAQSTALTATTGGSYRCWVTTSDNRRYCEVSGVLAVI